jgi:hypothetical protein
MIQNNLAMTSVEVTVGLTPTNLQIMLRVLNGGKHTKVRLVLLVIAGCVALFVSGSVGWRLLERRGLMKADQLELCEIYDRWVEAGRPQGDALFEFLHGRRKDLIATNRYMTIGISNYVTQFGLTQSMSGWAGTLFVTTNRALIWSDASGSMRLIER